MNEQTSPTRAEIEALLWAGQGTSADSVKASLASFLSERGMPDTWIDRILADITSYNNWKYFSGEGSLVEEDNA